ncbi:SCO family protein [Marinilabilia rubra]|uniref:SCO family protein n=1 Tax=Marinilabilia rubra TaxID=2162893 RepID=A0A2U2BA18_9BACT|nr:SCO family protein [Marinilabilia rubra]PWD99883.1 SCO family protein [Marinilabilia rubra]
MKQILIIFFLAFFNFNAFSQAPNPEDIEVGIVEHLGDTIPLDLKFMNEANDTVTLGSIIDKPTVLSFVYFDCPGLCSPLLSGVSDVVEKMDMKLGEEYQVVTISFNTKDTPEKAKTKKKNFVQNISKDNREAWVYLTGEQENILTITEAVGFKYKPQGLDFAHPSAIILVSPEGKITRYLYGINFLPFDLKMAVIEAQDGIARPTINKILEYCFAYDPASKGYSLQITRIVGGLILGIILIALTILLIKGKRRTAKQS